MSSTESNEWYNSHGEFMTVGTFIDLEVLDRKNMDMRTVEVAFREAGIQLNNNDMCIWVTQDVMVAASYSDAGEVNTVDVSDGTIIEGTDDGDSGFLFVQRPVPPKAEEPKKLKILREDFINWYFADETIGVACKRIDLMESLTQSGEFIVSAQDLLDGCGYIPKDITFNKEDYPEDYEPAGSEYEMKLFEQNLAIMSRITINQTARKAKQKELVAVTIKKLEQLANEGKRLLVVPTREYLTCYDKSWAFADDVKEAVEDSVSTRYGSSIGGVEFYIKS